MPADAIVGVDLGGTGVRAGKASQFNGKDISRYPERDVRIEPGDRVIVGRSYI